MRILGINDSSHDAAVSVIEDGQILFAAHSERYNGQKNTHKIDPQLMQDALKYGRPDKIAYYEKRNKKRLRKALHGGLGSYRKNLYKKYFDLPKEIQVDHHYSHACAGYYTSPFDEACIVVLDAIGEFETASIWHASGDTITKKVSWKYPFSYGLFYSAWTDFLGLKAGEDEYILMGMSAYGDPTRFRSLVWTYFPEWNRQTYNFHRGINDIDRDVILQTEQDKFDLAAAVQEVYTLRLMDFMQRARTSSRTKNLVFMGGCALNCAANTQLFNIWDDVWIMPNPGDAGSSLGAALAVYGRHVTWRGSYLGHMIPGQWPVTPVFESLKESGIVGVAAGRAEFGPRALGNRSLLADPRDSQIKDALNVVKKRQKFRPFAPVVLEEHANEFFEIDRPSPYMQYAVKCRKPELIPAAVHVDGTCRVQTVNEDQHPDLFRLLKRWHDYSGVPVLVNTSLNIKGKPIVNSLTDATKWQETYKSIRIHTSV